MKQKNSMKVDEIGDSSMESHTEVIWPVDSMEGLLEKNIKAHIEILGKNNQKLSETKDNEFDAKISGGFNDKEAIDENERKNKK